MIKLNYLRILVLLGLTLGLMSFNAKADSKKPPTQTDTRGIDSGSPRSGAPLGTDDLVTTEPDFENLNDIIRDRVKQRGGQYILGRETEVNLLEDKLAIADSHTVVVQGEAGSGRTGLVEEFVRQNMIKNPEDKVVRLNLRNLDLKSEANATQSLKRILIQLEQENIERKGQSRVILVIDNLSALLKGELLQPISALREFIAREGRLFTIIEGDMLTVKEQITKGKYAKLQNSVEVIEVKPPTYDAVVARLMSDKAQLQRSNISISQLAVENAARIAVRYRQNRALKYAYQILEGSVRLLESDMRAGSLSQDRLKGEVAQLQRIRDSVAADLTAETDASEKAVLQKRLAQIDRDLKSKQGDIGRLTVPTDSRAQLAQLEAEKIALELELEKVREEVRGKKSWIQNLSGMGGGNSPAEQAAVRIGQEIERKTLMMNELESLILNSEETQGRPATRVGPKQVVAIASKWLNIPATRLSANFDEGVQRIQDIKKQIFGQDHVIDALESRLLVSATHLQDGPEILPHEAGDVLRGIRTDRDRPLGSFFFAGSTGVGKTETALQLSNTLGYELVRLDMTEFQQDHMVSRLIGSPPGYVGSTEPGELIRKIKENPEAVLLFDEIEKAHPRILDALIPILDAGRLSAANTGETIDFRKTIIVITSNLAQQIGSWNRAQSIEFLKTTGKMSDQQIEQLTKYDLIKLQRESYRVWVKDHTLMNGQPLRPELVERIDDLIMFNKLTEETAVRIAQKTVSNLVNRMKNLYQVSVKFAPDAIVELMAGFNSEGGGRSMRRAFDELFRAPIARLMAERKLTSGDMLLVNVNPQRELELMKTTPAMVAAAEKATQSSTPELTEMKDKLLSRAKNRGAVREARSATAELVRRTFNKEWFVSERAFARLKGK
ncbi:MAG: AAA family ATPase [Bdellovibrionales bacterium]|nr:AAA family ATPase [Bdellovibrionales bacterium]